MTLAWQTVSETGNAGFNVYRSTSDAGPWAKVNAALIPAAAPGSADGHAYTWTDASAEAGSTYFYQLEDVALSGATTVHAPVSVTLVGPNAVGLNSLSASDRLTDGRVDRAAAGPGGRGPDLVQAAVRALKRRLRTVSNVPGMDALPVRPCLARLFSGRYLLGIHNRVAPYHFLSAGRASNAGARL